MLNPFRMLVIDELTVVLCCSSVSSVSSVVEHPYFRISAVLRELCVKIALRSSTSGSLFLRRCRCGVSKFGAYVRDARAIANTAVGGDQRSASTTRRGGTRPEL